jgi:hypothetical protein
LRDPPPIRSGEEKQSLTLFPENLRHRRFFSLRKTELHSFTQKISFRCLRYIELSICGCNIHPFEKSVNKLVLEVYFSFEGLSITYSGGEEIAFRQKSWQGKEEDSFSFMIWIIVLFSCRA